MTEEQVDIILNHLEEILKQKRKDITTLLQGKDGELSPTIPNQRRVAQMGAFNSPSDPVPFLTLPSFFHSEDSHRLWYAVWDSLATLRYYEEDSKVFVRGGLSVLSSLPSSFGDDDTCEFHPNPLESDHELFDAIWTLYMMKHPVLSRLPVQITNISEANIRLLNAFIFAFETLFVNGHPITLHPDEAIGSLSLFYLALLMIGCFKVTEGKLISSTVMRYTALTSYLVSSAVKGTLSALTSKKPGSASTTLRHFISAFQSPFLLARTEDVGVIDSSQGVYTTREKTFTDEERVISALKKKKSVFGNHLVSLDSVGESLIKFVSLIAQDKERLEKLTEFVDFLASLYFDFLLSLDLEKVEIVEAFKDVKQFRGLVSYSGILFDIIDYKNIGDVGLLSFPEFSDDGAFARLMDDIAYFSKSIAVTLWGFVRDASSHLQYNARPSRPGIFTRTFITPSQVSRSTLEYKTNIPYLVSKDFISMIETHKVSSSTSNNDNA